MASLFEAYITNLGKYNEGELDGETLKFPTTKEEVQGLLKRIGVDGVRYEEFFITSFDGDVLGLYDYLTEYENLDELNHLACLLSELTSSELETLEAVLDSGEHCSSVRDIINLTQNLDCYGFYPGVSDEETLGRIYVDDLEMLDVPDQVKPYFDYEAYGRDACILVPFELFPQGRIGPQDRVVLRDQAINALLRVVEEVLGQGFGELHIVAVQVNAAAVALDELPHILGQCHFRLPQPHPAVLADVGEVEGRLKIVHRVVGRQPRNALDLLFIHPAPPSFQAAGSGHHDTPCAAHRSSRQTDL